MLKAFSNLPYDVQALIWVGGSLLLSYLLMLLTHKLVGFEDRRKHHEEVGFIFAVVGIFTGLVIASVLVISIDHFNKTNEAVENEANVIGNVIRTARSTSSELSASVNTAMIAYLQVVSRLEWDDADRAKNLAAERTAINDLSLVISKYQPKTIRETNYHAVLLTQLTKLYRARRERGFLAHGVISPQIWTATLVVGVLTLLFAFLFGHESRKLHFVMTSILAMAMAIIFSLILVFDRPFQGDVAVSNEPFTVIIHHLKANQAWFKKNGKHSP